MDNDDRAEWAEEFDKIATKINKLTYNLKNNKDVNEFIKELESHKKDLESKIILFKDAI